MRFISKEFRRRCYKTLAIFFALVTVLDAGLWIRGKFVCDLLAYNPPTDAHGMTTEYRVWNSRQALVLDWIYVGTTDAKFVHVKNRAQNTLPFEGIERVFGFKLQQGSYVVGSTGLLAISIAHRTIVILSLAMCLLFARLGWRKRFPAGSCQKCGYDLRATPDRCPECGTIANIRTSQVSNN